MAEAENQNEQQFAIQRLYAKDLSFEVPNAPAIFAEQAEPSSNVELGTAAQRIEEGVFEVVLTVTLTTKVGDKTLYVAEVQQAGIFALSGFDDAQLGQVLGAYCPNILFPYARATITDLVVRGSFPQILLNPVNFDMLYAEHLRQQQEQQGQQDVH